MSPDRPINVQDDPRDAGPIRLVEIQITDVTATHARYECDSGLRAIRLTAVQGATQDSCADAPIDRGEIVIAGKAVPVLVVRRVPAFPDCRLTGRIIGLHQHGERAAFVAVPTMDPAFQRVATLSDLPAHLLACLMEAIPAGIWQEEAAARERYRQTFYAERTTRAQERRLGGRAWQAEMSAPERDLRDEAERHSAAEYHLRDVPARFQDYVVELLLPSERILALIHRPPPVRRGLFRRATLPEALLLVTDRQLLAMVDTIPPDVTMARWGFTAESAPLEKLGSVSLRDERRTAILTVSFMAAAGPSAIAFALPDGHEALEPTRLLLADFVPRPGDRRLQRHYRVSEPDNWAALGAFWRFDPNGWRAFTTLCTRVQDALPPDEPIHHYAIDPAWDRDRGALLLALTPSRLVVAEEGKDITHIPLDRISSVLLQRAPIGSWLGVTIPDGATVHERRFHCYAFAYPAFARLFTLLRQAIGTSIASRIDYQEREAADD
jgi:hypothetical protein